MRALVLWSAPDSANLGVQALAEGATQCLREALGEDAEVDYLNFGVHGLNAPRVGPRSLARGVLKPRRGNFSGLCGTYDLVVDTGAGDSFSTLYGARRFAELLSVRRQAVASGTPVVLAPQTVGPFTRHGQAFARRSLSGVHRAWARDSVSLQVLESLSGRMGRVDVASDMVFSLPPAGTVRTPRETFLNVSGLLWSRSSDDLAASYKMGSRNLLLDLHARGRVSLLAHVNPGTGVDDDTFACEDLLRQTGLTGQVDLLVPRDLFEARQLINDRAHIVIASRMHACLNALSIGVPAVALAYSRKFAPLLLEIGWSAVVDLRRADWATVAASLATNAADGSLDSAVSDVAPRARRTLDPFIDSLREAVRKS